MDNDSGVPLEIYSFLILELFVDTNGLSVNSNQIREHVEERLNALEVTSIDPNHSEWEVGYGTDCLTHIEKAFQILLQSDCLEKEKTIRESQVVNIDDDRYAITHLSLIHI